MSAKAIASLGLVLDILGVCVLFRFGFPQPDLDDEIKIVTGGKDPEAAAKRKTYVLMSSFGLACLIGGFLLQLLANWW